MKKKQKPLRYKDKPKLSEVAKILDNSYVPSEYVTLSREDGYKTVKNEKKGNSK